jgi:hypothetical protein
MAYPAGEQTVFDFPEIDEGSYTPQDVTAIYHVSVVFHKDGHACTSYGWVDMGTRVALTIKQECYQTQAESRKTALRLAQETARRAALDE